MPGRIPPDPADPSALNAIMVPATRPAHNLEHAITLARATRCHLVIMCSRDTHAAEVYALLDMRSFYDATVIKIPDQYTRKLFEFETTDWIKRQFPGPRLRSEHEA